MSKMVQRKLSGYCLNLPKGFKLVVRDCRTGEMWSLSDDLYYWMNQTLWTIFGAINCF